MSIAVFAPDARGKTIRFFDDALSASKYQIELAEDFEDVCFQNIEGILAWHAMVVWDAVGD